MLTLSAAAPGLAQAPQMPTLPLTQLDESGPAADLDNRTFTLTFAEAVPVKDLLLLLVRGTNLSLIPDPAIDGSFIGELKNVTVRQALNSILPPLGLDYRVDAGFIHVRIQDVSRRVFFPAIRFFRERLRTARQGPLAYRWGSMVLLRQWELLATREVMRYLLVRAEVPG